MSLGDEAGRAAPESAAPESAAPESAAPESAAPESAAAEGARAKLRAYAHPLRMRILSLLTGTQLTAAEVARELSLNHANASYHLRQLEAAGLIEVAGLERIRGGVAKRYRYDLEKDLAAPDVLPPPDPSPTHEHLLVYAALADELRRRSQLMRRTMKNYLADAELWVDPEAWATIRDRIADAADDLHRAAQPPRTAGTIRVSTTVALFEMEPNR